MLVGLNNTIFTISPFEAYYTYGQQYLRMAQSTYKFIPFKEITNSRIYVQQLKLLYSCELCLLRSVTDIYCDP